MVLPSEGSPLIESSVSSASGVSTAQAAKKIILDQIIASERVQNKISMVYKETLREMLRIFNEIFYMNSENALVNIKCVHGTPERTIAKLKQETNIILPTLSVTQTISLDDKLRRKTDYTLLHNVWWDEAKQRAYRVVSMAPRPINVQYSLNVWSKYKSDLDQITEQVRLKFYPSMNVVTPFSKFNQAFLAEEIDQSSIDLGDKEDRILRKAFSITLQTYIPTAAYLVTSTGELEKLNTEVPLVNEIIFSS